MIWFVDLKTNYQQGKEIENVAHEEHQWVRFAITEKVILDMDVFRWWSQLLILNYPDYTGNTEITRHGRVEMMNQLFDWPLIAIAANRRDACLRICSLLQFVSLESGSMTPVLTSSSMLAAIYGLSG